LLDDNRGSHGLNRADATRDLGNDACDCRLGIATKRRDGFQVGLHPGPAGIIGSRNSEYDWWIFFHSWNKSAS